MNLVIFFIHCHMEQGVQLDEYNYGKAANFFKYYDLEAIIGNAPAATYLGDKKEPRICRFCHNFSPDVTFKKDAHVIPQFMGNKNLMSYFECDECNQLFSKYEDSFANYFGVTRTFAQIKGQSNKVPKFKDNKTGLEVRMGKKSIEMIMIDGEDPVTWDTAAKSIKIATMRPGHIPIHILKTIVKMGLCMLPDEEMAQHEITRKFVVESASDEKYKGAMILKVMAYFIPGPPFYSTPFVHLYKLKNEGKDVLLPMRQIVLQYANWQFQMVLPFAEADRRLIGTKPDLPIYPLLIDQSFLDTFGNYQFSMQDFSSNEKKKASEHTLSFSYSSLVDETLKPPDKE